MFRDPRIDYYYAKTWESRETYCAKVASERYDRMRKLESELAGYRALGSVDHLRELVQADQDGRLVVLPCKVGNPVYRIYDDCTFPGDCGTKRMCQGCEYRNLFVEEQAFCISMLNQSGQLESPYYKTRKEAEAAMEAQKGDNTDGKV